MLNQYAPYVPRLLDEPWVGARIAAGSIVFCELSGLSPSVEDIAGSSNGHVAEAAAVITEAFDDLSSAAQAHGGDVLSFGGSSLCVLFTGDGRQGRAINAAHAMHEALSGNGDGLVMSAGIASGLVHLVISGDDPRHLITIGPTVSKAIELASLAVPGTTRSGRVDHSGMATQGKTVAWPASDFLASSIQSMIESDEVEPAGGLAAVGFAVFSGVDQALQRNPARATRQVEAVVEVVQRAAAEFGVTVLGNDVAKGGGTLLLTAGLPVPADDDEERLFQAAKAALEAEPPLALRFGIATGPVLAGSVGGSTRRTYAVIGETVDLAARLAASAFPADILTTHRAIDRATTRYEISEGDPVTFAGSDAQIIPVTVGQELASDGEGAGGFVGRSEERANLVRSVGALEHGRGGVIDIVGEPGIGKTRLVAEALRGSELATVVVRCDEYLQAKPYRVASSLLRAVMGIGEDEDPKRVGVLLEAKVRGLTPYLERWLPLLAEVVGGQVRTTKAVRDLCDTCRRQRTHVAVAQLVAWLTEEPLVVRIEDAHWMDAASADLLSFVLAGDAELPWLIISTRRPTDTGWNPGDKVAAFLVEVGPLAPGPVRALLTELRRGDPQPDGALIERSNGNPMFVELLARGGEATEAPDDIGAAVRARLDGLEPSERAALEGAAVLGMRFAPDLAGELLAGVDWARLSEFVEPVTGGQLQFRHGSVRDALYAGLSTRRRRTLHHQAAEALVGRDPDPALLAVHAHRAGDHGEAWKRARLAGTEAFERGAFVEAAALLEIALESATRLESATNKDVAAVAELLGDADIQAGRLEDADKVYVVARHRLRGNRDKARLLAKRADVREREGSYAAALRMLTGAINALPKRSGPGDRAPLEYRYARVRTRQGRYTDAIERGERAIALAAKAGDDDTLGRAHYVTARARSLLDRGRGTEDLLAAVQVFGRNGDHLRLAKALDRLGVEAYERGRWDEALDYQARNAQQRQVAGDVAGGAQAAHYAALVLLHQGKNDEAEEALERVRLSSRAANYRRGVAGSTMNLAEIEARRGNTELALGMLEDTLAQFEAAGASQAENRLAQAEAHLLGGDVEGALASAEKAMESEELEAVVLPRIGLQRVRGTALVWLGKSEEGHVQLLEALDSAQRAEAPLEEALISDALTMLFGDGEAEDRRDEIMERLGIVQLPPFLTIS